MRIVVALCGVALLSVLILPIWQIQLSAPQYPEGLVLLIYANKLGGSVDVINGLNHYIGMKTLHANDFIEFTVLPYIIAAFAVLFFIIALINKRKGLYVLLVSFIAFGVIAMSDFWKWEYNYGHDLDPDAAIKVPGMAYQPPLIGYKQLLNFGAYSIPDIGGWIFIGVGVIVFSLVIVAWKQTKAVRASSYTAKKIVAIAAVCFAVISFSSCNVKPQEIQLGKDNCYYCKMTVSDPRFGAEVITKKGKIYKFDDAHCLLSFLKSGEVAEKDIRDVYFVTFSSDHGFVKSGEAALLKSDALHSPMNGNVAAFANTDSMRETLSIFKGTPINWKDLRAE